ncbi:MAG TPA: metal-dependent hydrolase [Terriglobia bacterium]|nr:metal-dependent hydrolase [Terriglobia bacterium]
MDNLTHTLTGIALSQAGLNRKTRFATLALILGSNAPDVDIVTRFRSSTTYLEYHRGITHSLLGASGLAVILAALIYSLGRLARAKLSKPPLNARWLFLLCWMAVLGHIVLDFTNAYGVRPFEPFSGRWFSWDIMPIIDPTLLLLLVCGLGLPLLFRLVSEELGARKTGYRRGAVVALVGMLLLWGLRDFSHRRALALLEANNYGDEPAVRAGAFPTLNPLVWRGVVETDSAYHVLPANALASDVAADYATSFRKPQPSPALAAALQTHVGRVFSNFARFPWAQVEVISGAQTGSGQDGAEDNTAGQHQASAGFGGGSQADVDGYEVRIHDLRFGAESGAFQASIDLDRNLRPHSETFTFMGRPAD